MFECVCECMCECVVIDSAILGGDLLILEPTTLYGKTPNVMIKVNDILPFIFYNLCGIQAF